MVPNRGYLEYMERRWRVLSPKPRVYRGPGEAHEI